ncbi:MAG: 50S ribosomal protein L9 [Ignavibacteria bacterium]
MKVILKQDHELLGDQGQIVDVKNGYARNYLIPKGFATTANASNLKTFEEVKRQKGRKVKKETDDAEKLASEIEGNSINIFVKTGEDDRVFGSVTSQMIYDALVEKGFTSVDKKKIILKEQIKSLGEHEVEVKLQHSIIAKIKVNVLNEKSEDAPSPSTDEDEQVAIDKQDLVNEEEKVS